MRGRYKVVVATLLALLVLGGVGTYNYLRPVDPVAATRLVASVQRIPGSPPTLPWPAKGAAAVGAVGIGEVASTGSTKPVPIASVAKAMTALVVIESQPLDLNAPGPVTEVTLADVDAYNAARAEQSTVAVRAGEQLTEKQLLQGLLIPSGNNFADLLARSVAGSTDAFVTRMNSRAASLKMTHTHFADASGFNGQTVSTPSDLIFLAIEFVAHPVLVQIASLADAQLPVAGTVYNVDYALGRSGIFGIKTGSSGDAGACFVFAAHQTVAGKDTVIVGAVLGLDTLDNVFAASQKLIEAAAAGFSLTSAAAAGQRVAAYKAPWGSQTGIVPDRDLLILAWPGMLIHRALVIPSAQAPLAAGSAAGHLIAWVGDGAQVDAALQTEDGLFPPGKVWRVTRLAPTQVTARVSAG